jgi:glutamate/tyrosine decarboxylase-like PLP-dependent enzyme
MNAANHEETLDPQDPQGWEDMRALGHRMVDDMFDYMQTLRDRPVWQPIPDAVKAQFELPIPHEPQDVEAVYEEFVRDVLPYPSGNIHPRFWGWVVGTGTPLGALAEFLAGVMNPNLGGAEHSANRVEMQVLNWLKGLMGYPQDASGLMVSGASMANMVALTVARNVMAGYDLRESGLTNASKRMMFYTSTEAHSCIPRALEVLGLGRESLHKIPVNDAFEMDLDALQAAIDADRAAGLEPVCVVGSAGTVNTGAFDDLEALADLCTREKMWFHVDGAFGALAALSKKASHLVKGMDRADSLAFDLHKWMFVQYEAAVVLVRRGELHHRTFSTMPEYLVHGDRGAASGPVWFSEYGVQLSRGFRALKVWMSIKEHGIDKYARLIDQNIAQAHALAVSVDAEPELERLAPVALNIVCFRYTVPDWSNARLNTLNDELVIRLHERGMALATSTVLHGKSCLRPSATNHRSTTADFDVLVSEVLAIGRDLVEEMTQELAESGD